MKSFRDIAKATKDPDQVPSAKKAQKDKEAKKISPALFNKLRKYQLNTTNNVDVLASLNIWTAGDLARVPLNQLVHAGIKVVHARKLKAISLEDVERQKRLKLEELNDAVEIDEPTGPQHATKYNFEPSVHKLPYSVKEPKTHSRPKSAPRPTPKGKSPAWAETGAELLKKTTTPRVTTSTMPHADYWSPNDYYAKTAGLEVDDEEIDEWLNTKLQAQQPPQPPRGPPPPSLRRQVRRSFSADDSDEPRRFFGGAPVPRQPATRPFVSPSAQPRGPMNAFPASPRAPPPPSAPSRTNPHQPEVASSRARPQAEVSSGTQRGRYPKLQQGSFLDPLGRDGWMEESFVEHPQPSVFARPQRGRGNHALHAHDQHSNKPSQHDNARPNHQRQGDRSAKRGASNGRLPSWFEEDDDLGGNEVARKARVAAIDLIAKGKELKASRRLDEALACFEAAATKLNRVVPKKGTAPSQGRTLLASALFLSAAVHRKQGRLEAAAQLYEACYQLQEAEVSAAHVSSGAASSGPSPSAGTPPDSQALQLSCANTCNDWAMALQSMGDHEGALYAFQKALRIKGALRGENHPEYGMALVRRTEKM